MKLDVRERLILLSILPAEGNFITLKVVRKLRESLSFNEEELKTYRFVQEEQRVTWDDKAEQSKLIEIGTQAKIIIQNELKKLNDADPPKLRDEHYSIYEKFIEKEK